MRRLGPSSRQTSAQLGPLGSKLGPNLGPTGGFGRKLRLRFMHMWSKSGPTWRSLGQFSGSFGTSWAQTLPNTEPPSSPTKKNGKCQWKRMFLAFRVGLPCPPFEFASQLGPKLLTNASNLSCAMLGPTWLQLEPSGSWWREPILRRYEKCK